MTKTSPLLDLALILVSALLLLAAFMKYQGENKARERLGGDVVMQSENREPDLGIFAFLSMHAEKQSQIMTVETAARASKTKEKPESESRPVLLKVIDQPYPLYGKLELTDKKRRLIFASFNRGKLQGSAVSPSLLSKLSLEPGEHFMIGETEFVAAAVIAREPDYDFTEGDLPRIMISNRAFNRLVRDGMFFENPQRFEVRASVKDGVDLVTLKQSFDDLFAGAGWKSALWSDQVPRLLLGAKMPFLLITAGILLLIVMVRYERRKQRAGC
jgi:putative ABC transport system permease protein